MDSFMIGYRFHSIKQNSKTIFHHPLKVESTWDKFQFKKMESQN